jgi:CHAP domain
VQFTDVVSRVAELQTLAVSTLGQGQPAPAPSTAPAGGSAFAQLLAAAGEPYAASAGSGSGSAVLAAAESQVGQTEQPPGSNDGPAIATYRTAVAGAQPGEPWCAYFASWAAQQAGTPIGDTGQGLGSVAEITDWAQRTGRYLPAGSTPAPGDLILFGDEHVGVVESVNPDGSLTTVEGNYDNGVDRVQRQPSEATGFVRMG